VGTVADESDAAFERLEPPWSSPGSVESPRNPVWLSQRRLAFKLTSVPGPLAADLARYDRGNGLYATVRVLARYQQTWALVDYRFGVWARRRRCLPLLVLSAVLHRFVEITTGISISPRAEIGPGLLIAHFGGIVIGPGVKMGLKCALGHDVTIGQADGHPGSPSPTIGDAVTIAPGARVFGAITVGPRSVIGANAVLNTDIPADAVAAGVPARVVKIRGQPTAT
jgi:serine O-acetyltransferase